jgi:membrane fusion protein, multidrug efflux system
MKRYFLLRAAIPVFMLWVLAGCQEQQESASEEKVATEVTVQVGKVVSADLRARVEAYGMVEPELAQAGHPGGGAKLAPATASVVLAVLAAEGQKVKSGDVVVRLDDRMAQAAVDKAEHAVAFAEQNANRQEKLKSFDGTSDKAVAESRQKLAAAQGDLASARAALAQVHLVSPLDGIVAHVNVLPGQSVDPTTVVAEIVDPERLVVTLGVPANDAPQLKPGQPADVTVESADGPVTAASVSFVAPSVDPKTGAVLARLALPAGSTLRPGQFVRARIVTAKLAGRLAVPRESVVKAEDAHVIYLVVGDKAVQTTVKTGIRDGNLVEIEAKEVKEGDTIVTVGAYGLPKETRIKFASH